VPLGVAGCVTSASVASATTIDQIARRIEDAIAHEACVLVDQAVELERAE